MCGIAGFISLTGAGAQAQADSVKAMLHTLYHRGPDSAGLFISDHALLGNTRLSIQDPSPQANLPMCSETDDVWIAFNGEISNFRELKAKFQLGNRFSFKTQSDTEVLIYLYKLLGIGFLQELSGMFAFCLYDMKINKVFLVRDFYGIIPLYYHQNSQGIFFASELKALLEVPEFTKTLNQTAAHHFFSLAYIPDNLTPFQNITELRGGELIEIDLIENINQKRQYYNLTYRENHDISEKEATQKVRDLLIDSVERNLVSDAPLGMTLSGGIDTSAMLGIVKHLGLGSKMHTFSLKMGERSFDESKYQQIMAKYAGSIHHEILVTPDDVIDNMLAQVAHTDEPNGNGACIPSFILAQKASSEVKVLLSGEGGDELFNAYPTIAAYQIRKKYKQVTPKFVRTGIRKIVESLPANYKKLSFDFKAKRFTAGVELDTPDAHMYWRHVLTHDQKARLLNGTAGYPETEEYYRNIFAEYASDHEINRISRIDMRHFFIDDLMVKNDRTFLGNSVEGRFPFMDRMLVEYVTSLPVNYRVKGFSQLRWIEKEAMKPFLPKEIYNRDGFGLEMPHSIWFMDKLGTFAKKYLNPEFVNKTELLNWHEIEKIWNLHQSGKADYGRVIWCILNYLIWFDLFIYEGNYKTYLTSSRKKNEITLLYQSSPSTANTLYTA